MSTSAGGRKRQNAKLLSVEINGVLVHENLELSGPTGGAIGDDEVASAPLMIQGDHGPVAFRNFRLHAYDATPPTLDLDFSVYYDSAESPLDGFDGLAGRTADTEEHYNRGHVRSASASLEPGRHRFQAGYLKKGALGWQQANPPGLALFVRGPGFREVALQRIGGLDRFPVDPVLLDADTARVIRSFADVGPEGGTCGRVVHAINVGSPQEIQYTLDYDQGTIVRAWRGEFLDATPMWYQRGDGSSRPRGSEEFLTMRPLVARLADDREPWPDPYGTSGFRPERYRIGASGLPVFHYGFAGARIEDTPRAMDGRRLERRLTISEPVPTTCTSCSPKLTTSNL